MQNQQSYIAPFNRGSYAPMQNIDFFISRELSHSHKVKRLSLWIVGAPLYFISAQCATFMYACLCHFKERMIVATFRVSKIGLYWQQLWKKENTEKKKNIILSPGFCEQGGRCFLLWRCQDVCHPGFIHLLCYLFFGVGGRSHTPHTHTHSSPSLAHRGLYLEVSAVRCRHSCNGRTAGPPQESAAICFKSSLVNNGVGVLVKVVAVGGVAAKKKNGVHHAKAGGWVDSKRFSCLLSGGDEATNRAQTEAPETADSFLFLFVCPVPWIWLKSYSYCSLTLCIYTILSFYCVICDMTALRLIDHLSRNEGYIVLWSMLSVFIFCLLYNSIKWQCKIFHFLLQCLNFETQLNERKENHFNTLFQTTAPYITL